jgi:hypothetical protein
MAQFSPKRQMDVTSSILVSILAATEDIFQKPDFFSGM